MNGLRLVAAFCVVVLLAFGASLVYTAYRLATAVMP